MDSKLREHKFIVFCQDHYNPLGIVRSLGEEGIRTIVILESKMVVNARSTSPNHQRARR